MLIEDSWYMNNQKNSSLKYESYISSICFASKYTNTETYPRFYFKMLN